MPQRGQHRRRRFVGNPAALNARRPSVVLRGVSMSDMSDRGEFSDFAAATSPGLLKLARALSRDEHEAWDLLQDAYVRVGVRWAKVAGTTDPVAYTRQTMVRLAIDRSRRREVERKALHRWSVLNRRDLDPVERVPSTSSDVAWLPAAWRSLTVKQRAVVALVLLEDRSQEEVADLLGCGVTTVRTHLSRGLGRLRAASPQLEGRSNG